jgi:hypothetical protein
MAFNKLTVLTPSVLYREDFAALEALIRNHFPADEVHFNIREADNSSGQVYPSLDVWLAANNAQEQQLDELTIEAFSVRNGEKDHRISLYLCKRISNVHFHSRDDNGWITDFQTDLKRFFQQHRPWYWYFAQSVPPVLNISVGLALVMAAFIIVSKVYAAVWFPVLLVASALVYFGLGISKKLFRHARLCLFPRVSDHRPNLELYALGTHAAVLAISVTGILTMTAGKI